ncbi:putative defense protein 3 [Ceratina calcarata]|uniref:Defense protein 3 n=1 Tax=Ceratina calcarata TaxID=156304 RepID=A0AAJ7N5K2_9HYME|nr:putative defense protein 3 [Ceratina calcarata]
MAFTMRNLGFGVLVVASLTLLTHGYPTGAPVDVCAMSDGEPHHGTAVSQPANTSPYTFTASSSEYSPNSQITVTISGAPFKGFLIQARDKETGSWIGSWEKTDQTNTHPECSAVTHADPHVKEEATFIWTAPPKGQGHVEFTGTILKEYSTFWSKLVATVNH